MCFIVEHGSLLYFLCYSVFLLINYFLSKNILLLYFFYTSDFIFNKIHYGILPEVVKFTSQIYDDVELQDR